MKVAPSVILGGAVLAGALLLSGWRLLAASGLPISPAEVHPLLPPGAVLDTVAASFALRQGKVVPVGEHPAVFPVTLPGGEAAVVVGYLLHDPQDVDNNLIAHLAVYGRTPLGLRQLWAPAPCGRGWGPAALGEEDVEDGTMPVQSLVPTLCLRDLTGSGFPQIISCCSAGNPTNSNPQRSRY